jgi:hypothetical protein
MEDCRFRPALFVSGSEPASGAGMNRRESTMRYMLLIYEAQRPEPGSRELAAAMAAVNEFTEELQRRGSFVTASPLAPPATATRIRVADGETLMTDGPFAETAEWLGGYYIVETRDRDEALELGARFASVHNGSVEVRAMPDTRGAHRNGDGVAGGAAR